MLSRFFPGNGVLVVLLLLSVNGVSQDGERKVPPERFIPGQALTVWVPADSAGILSLSGGYPIDEEGNVEFPILGKLQVADKSRTTLEQYLGEQLSPYLRDTHVRVWPAWRIAFLGNFKQSGMYYIHPDRVVWDAYLHAGGPRDERNLDEMKVLRGSELLGVQALDVFSSGKTLRQAGIHSGDIFVIPTPTDKNTWYYVREGLAITQSIAGTIVAVFSTYFFVQSLNNN